MRKHIGYLLSALLVVPVMLLAGRITLTNIHYDCDFVTVYERV